MSLDQTETRAQTNRGLKININKDSGSCEELMMSSGTDPGWEQGARSKQVGWWCHDVGLE